MDLKGIFNDFFAEVGSKLPNILTGILVLIIFIVLGKLYYRYLGRVIQKRWQDSIISNFLSHAIKWSFYIFGMIIALNVIGFGNIASSLLAGAGISAIIFGFAFKDIGENFLAGIILALKRPFEIDDIIEVEGHKGTVKDLDMRMTHLRNVEGKDIYIPNSSIIKNALINYTKDGNFRVSFMIGIAPECSISETHSLIMGYLGANKQILKKPAPKVLVQELGEFTTNIQVLFWVDITVNKKLPDSYLGHTIRSKVITDIKEILDQNNIEMPSQVVEHKMYRDHKIRISNQQ